MSKNSVFTKIKDRVTQSAPGTVFFLDSFTPMGSSEAIRTAFVRLCKENILTKAAQGIYYYPKYDPLFGFAVPLSEDEIAYKIAEKGKSRIIPTGIYALNKTGLSSQLQTNTVFLTDGPTRKVKMHSGRSILFKHTSNLKLFNFRSYVMLLVVLALRELGKDNITVQHIHIIKGKVKNVPSEDYEHDVELAPEWMQKILK